jgi:hypothetical protein
VQERVVERPREHRHRLDRQRMDERVDLPEPEVPGEEQHAPPLRVGMDDALLPLELDALEHLLGPHGAELEQDREKAAEVREHLARDRPALLLRAHGKRRAQVLDGETPVAAIEQIEGAPEQRARRQHGAHGKQADHRDHADHGKILQPVPERRPRTRRRGPCGAMVVSQR